ncbi:hypothetical protein [Paenibacillus residui]|uniref:Uncharacterized protein n=1 Tax=Paenibacillus residui TaxID=629724 RepID=A0ABW3D908_9BACL
MEREYPLKDGGSLIRTEEGVLFCRSSPGMIPLLTDPEVEIDDVLECYRDVLDENRRLRKEIAKLEEEKSFFLKAYIEKIMQEK